VYVSGVPRLFLTLSVLVVVLVQAGGATGKSSYREWLTFKEVGFDGSKRLLSTHNVVPEVSSLSPDSRQLAYAPYVYGTKSKELWIANVRKAGERLLLRASGWIFTVAWAPNGRTIALAIGEPDAGIWLVESDGTGLRKVADGGYGPAWSPDSRQLIYYRYVSPGWHMAVVDLDTGSTRDLGEGQSLVWSPNAREIVYEKILGCDCLPEIRVMSVSTGISRKLVRGRFPSWSPDAGRIAYTRPRQGAPDSLWMIRSRGGKPRFLADRASTGVWSPNGRWIAFARLIPSTVSCKNGLILVPTRGGRTRRLAVEARDITPQAWTRGGRVLYSATKCHS
jgi:Tol biopolymer transport system component